ncbi:MAG: class I adenylate cyclase [Desulfovibrio sp.]|uniref:class I adenylate cyclase n=1 Tax=Desulfovibrio sp. 7SRBS1 TaxID=3378064 RepID=UPI003B3D3B9D
MRLEDIHPALAGMAPYPPSPMRWDDISSFYEAYKELSAQADPKTVSEQSSRIAYQLLKIAVSSHSTALVKIILKFWLQLGTVGRILFVRFLGMKVLPANVLMELVSTMPLKDQFHLLNELLLAGYSPDPHVSTWARNLLASDRSENRYDHDQALSFLADLNEGHRTLAPGTEEFLRRNDFFPWLLGLLEHPLDETDILRAAKVASMIPDRKIQVLLAGYIDGDESILQDTVVGTLENMDCRLPNSEVKRLVQVLPGAAESMRPRLLRLILNANVPNPEKLAAYICHNIPETGKELAQVLPSLPPDRTTRCLLLLPPKIRSQILGDMFQRICVVDPAFPWQYTPVEQVDPKIAQEFEHALRPTWSAPGSLEETDEDPTVQRIGTIRSGIEERIKYLMADHETVLSLASRREVKGTLAGVGISDISLRDRSLKWIDWKNAHLYGVSFENMTLHDVDFSGCLIENVIFHNCQLQKTDFTGAVFVNCLFQWTNVKNSSLAETTMSECRLSDVSFQACDLVNAVWAGIDLAMSRVIECSLWGFRAHKADLACMRFISTDFSHALMTQTTFRGCEFTQCLFEGGEMRDSESTDCRHNASLFRRCRFARFISDTPSVMISMHESILTGLSEECPPESLPEWAGTPGGNAAIRAFIDNWQYRVELLARRAAFAKEDRRRLALGVETLEHARASALKMIPLLLEHDLLEKRLQIPEQMPLCRVTAYTPDYTTWDMYQKHFDIIALDPPPADAIAVSGIFTVGAFGSLAQLSTSSVDLLICCHKPEKQDGDLTSAQMNGLRNKLDLIGRWVKDEFGLDLTFHLVSEESARENSFGTAAHESVPSAQGALIKDDIYATSIRLYGRDMLWRMTPFHSPSDRYAAAVKEIHTLWPELPSHYLDLGPLPRLSPESYVKALLWRTIKTFDRPYKAIRALVGLLQCVERNQPPSYICDKYKKAVFAGELRPDPFAMAFEHAREPYEDGSRPELSELLNILFILKTQCDQEVGPLTHPSLVLRQIDSRKILECCPIKPAVLCKKATHDFEFLAELGKQISLFMVSAFETVRNSFWGRFGLTPQESPELERLGRKLASSFRPGKRKIERLALVRPMSSLFSEVGLYAEKAPGRPTIWVAKGNLTSGLDRREDMVDVRRDDNLHALFAWLLANGFYTPKITMDADHSMNPISPRNVRELAAALQEFFPKRKTFDMNFVTLPDKQEITRALFIMNLVTARDINRVFETGIVYSTNMGEMFCAHSQVYDQTIKDNPLQYLKKITAQPCSKDIELGYFIPGKSRCPRPDIPKFPSS